MGDQLAARFIVTVNGKEYRSAPATDDPHQPIALEVEHRDNEATRMLLTVWDSVVNPNVDPYPEFNTMPNPRCNENIPVEAWGGWEDQDFTLLFSGILLGKRFKYQSSVSKTEFAGVTRDYKLRKRAKVDTLQNITVAQMLKKKGKEEGIDVQIDKSAAGDSFLNMPAQWIIQLGEPNWGLMLRYVREGGYVTVPKPPNILRVYANKEAGPAWDFTRGDGEIRSLELRYEQKRDTRSPRRRGSEHLPPPGQEYHVRRGIDCGGGKGREIQPTRITKKAKRSDRDPFKEAHVKNYARRLAKEGDELTLGLRLQPGMTNEDVIILHDFGNDIDGAWESASVVHRIGGGVATTEAACWRAGEQK